MSKDRKNLHVIVVVNGEFTHKEQLLSLIDNSDKVVAADGGANWLLSNKRLPHLLTGDMDSIEPDILKLLEKSSCSIIRHSPYKNKTDTELALEEAVNMGASRITILGALGNRQDHALANILLLLMPGLKGIQTSIFDGISYISITESFYLIKGRKGDLVSLLPFAGDVHGITLDGFEYPLEDDSLFSGSTRGVSNILMKSEGKITVKKGRLFIIHTPCDEVSSKNLEL